LQTAKIIFAKTNKRKGENEMNKPLEKDLIQICRDNYVAAEQKRLYECEKAEYRRFLYFLKQKLCGLALLMFTVVAICLEHEVAALAAFTVPIGLGLIFSKKPMIYGELYTEEEFYK
jgi:hypothetical protein